MAGFQCHLFCYNEGIQNLLANFSKLLVFVKL